MRKLAILAVLPALAACSGTEPAAPAGEESPAGEISGARDMPEAATDYSPPKLTEEAAKGEKGARNVLLAWAHAMEDRAFPAAYALFGRNGPASGQSESGFAASFAPYQTITAEIGEGEVEGAAGSLYYEVPVTLSGMAKDGSAYERKGSIVLRRVNDVPGAEDWQLDWHIGKIDWQDPAGANAS